MNVPHLATRSCITLCLAAVAIGLSGPANSEPASAAAPIVVAQATPTAAVHSAPAGSEAYPSIQRGVRAAAAQGTESLRRYVNRTRMIYAFYYNDFAPRE